METCYNGIAIPPRVVEACGGDYKSTDCILTPDALTYLGLPVSSSQSDINAAIQASLMGKDVLIAEIPVPNGSETKLTASTNVTITGTGTTLDPYVISATAPSGNPTLQEVLDAGRYATIGDVNNYTAFMESSPGGLYSGISIGDGTYYTGVTFQAGNLNMEGGSPTYAGSFAVYQGSPSMSVYNNIDDGNIALKFKPTIAATNNKLYLPGKIIDGDYTVNVTSDTIYTVGTLPAGVLNDMAIVSDATSPTYMGALTGGGSTVCPVWHNGTSWIAR